VIKLLALIIFAAIALFSFRPASYPRQAVPAVIEIVAEPPTAPAPTPVEIPEEPEPPSEEIETLFIEALIDDMCTRRQVSQLFMLSLGFTAPSDELRAFVGETGAGGYILFGNNITDLEGTRALTAALREFSDVSPFIGIDEEGGTVSRLSALPGYAITPAAGVIGAGGDAEVAYLAGRAIGEALLSVGVNVNFAPVADVLTNPRNTVIGNRAFGSDPAVVANMVSAFQAGLHSQGIVSAPKHFPGHGAERMPIRISAPPSLTATRKALPPLSTSRLSAR